MNYRHRSARLKRGWNITLAILATALLIIPTADANLNVTLNLDRNNGNFRASVYMFATGASVPTTHHRIESPNGIIYREIGDSSASSSPNLSFSAMIAECTAGLWTLTTNVGPSQEQYGFTVSISGVTEPMFGDTSITNPADYAATSTNQPLIEWSSTSLFPEVHIQVHNGFQPPEPGNWVNLVAPINSWTPPSPVLGGTNTIYMAYQTNGFGGITISLPTNAAGTAIADWNADADLSSYDFSHFVPPGGGGDPFDVAVESPGLSWSTYGDDSWFVSSLETWVGPSALQSGSSLPLNGSSVLEATVTGPGTVSFDWALFADQFDAFEFYSYDNSTGDDSDFFYYEGGDLNGWDSYFVTLSSNDTYTFTWTFYNNDGTAGDYDAAFLDNVIYSGPGGNSHGAEFEIKIERVISGASTYYVVLPSLNNVAPASSLDEVESPNGYSSGTETTSSSQNYPTLQAAIDEIEAGPWTIYFDRNGASHAYDFTITVNSLTTNDLPPVLILDPFDGTTGVSTNTDFMWLGPVGWDSLFVYVRDVEANTTVGSSSLSPGTTSWTTAPTLPTGTNSFTASYSSFNFGGLTISHPYNGAQPLSSWSSSAMLGARGISQFVTGSGVIPMPVTLLSPTVLGSDFGLSFISQSGVTHVVEWSTNLPSGLWYPATNFPGSGITNLVTLPTTNPAAFYRVQTQ